MWNKIKDFFLSPEENNFTDVPIRDNFYQTSSFFPMPVVLISTLAEDGQTNLGPYSLCFPHIISGRHAMMLITRFNSNTSLNIQRTGVASINFIPDHKAYMENCVELGFPGESTEEKMKNSIFTLVPSTQEGDGPFPDIVDEAVQVFECRWDSHHAHQENGHEYHFLLDIEKIVMKKKWSEALKEGRGFPPLPVDYGYRDGIHFWFSGASTPYAVDIPKHKEQNLDTLRFQTDRLDPSIVWEDKALQRLVKIPRIFLKKALNGILTEAREAGVTKIDDAFLEELQEKRKNK